MVRRRLYYRNMSLLILTMMSFLPCRFGIRLTEAWFTVQPPTIVRGVKTQLLPRQRPYYTVFSSSVLLVRGNQQRHQLVYWAYPNGVIWNPTIQGMEMIGD
jgi:hypothetical protein